MSECRAIETVESSAVCPRCARKGHVVYRETVAAAADLGVQPERLREKSYRFCGTPDCPIVYFGAGGAFLERDELRVAVSAKDQGLDVPLCYCFRHTRRLIAGGVTATKTSVASSAIAREIKASRCACEVKNPSGRCCLADVRAYETRLGEAFHSQENGGVGCVTKLTGESDERTGDRL